MPLLQLHHSAPQLYQCPPQLHSSKLDLSTLNNHNLLLLSSFTFDFPINFPLSN